jgi:hypothetical protein
MPFFKNFGNYITGNSLSSKACHMFFALLKSVRQLRAGLVIELEVEEREDAGNVFVGGGESQKTQSCRVLRI